MRLALAVVIVLHVGCGKAEPGATAGSATGSGSAAPGCDAAIEKIGAALAGQGTSELAALKVACEQAKWSPEVRRCAAGADTATAVVTCIEPALQDGERPRGLVAPTPSDDTRKRWRATPLRALVFFREGDVARAAKQYLTELGATGVTVHDRLLDPELAAKYRVTRDGIVLFRADDEAQAVTIALEGNPARELARLDGNVHDALVRLGRVKQVAYLVKGHGEIVDFASAPAQLKTAERRTKGLRDRLVMLGFRVEDLFAGELGKGVPADASVVLLLGPSTALPAAEAGALAGYLDRGGGLLLAFEPKGARSIAGLEKQLGVRFAPEGTLADPKAFYPQKRDRTDHHFVITTKFSAHASTSTLSRTVDKGLLLMQAGALEELPLAPATPEAPKRTVVIRSMDTSFLDKNADYELGAGEGPPASLPIAIAIEGPANRPFRAFVIADADVFADALTRDAAGRAFVVMVGGPLLDDVVRWIGKHDAIRVEEPARAHRDVLQALAWIATSPPPDRDAAKRELERALARMKSK